MANSDYQHALEVCDRYIQAHPGENITAEKLACEAGYNLSHFSFVFHAYTGLTISEYLRSFHLHTAAAALRDGKTVTRAAMETGFQTVSGFTRAFRKAFGITPGEYRRRVREGRRTLLPVPEIREMTFPYPVIGYLLGSGEVPPESSALQSKDGTLTPPDAAFWERTDFRAYPRYPADMKDLAEFAAQLLPDPQTGEPHRFFGCVTDYDRVPEGFTKLMIPDGLYAVFNVSDTVSTDPRHLTGTKIREAVNAVFTDWLPAREDLRFDEGRILFEYYEKNRAWLYVPVLTIS